MKSPQRVFKDAFDFDREIEKLNKEIEWEQEDENGDIWE